MRKMVWIPSVFGVLFLILGLLQSYSSLHPRNPIISNEGRIIVPNTSEPQPQQTTPTTQLSTKGILIILVSFGFFALVYVLNRKYERYWQRYALKNCVQGKDS